MTFGGFLWWLWRLPLVAMTGRSRFALPVQRPEGLEAAEIFGGFFGSVPRYSPVFQGVSPGTRNTGENPQPIENKRPEHVFRP